jgi:hypothetical protein
MKCCISALVCVCAVGRPSVLLSMGLINTLIEIALFNFDLAGGETLILSPLFNFFRGDAFLLISKI